MPEVVLKLMQLGILVLLWVFVLSAVRVVRSDLFGGAPPRVAAPLSRPVRQDRAERPRRRSAARKLVVTQGALAGTTLTLGSQPVTIGRSNDSTLVLTDDYASTRHARLVPTEGAWLVEDMGSTNGTYLDRTKVARPTPVPLGTPVRIGKTVLELRR
jgi:pSer/pThr/pTyr-binding forkhead associated (FHA) protein